MTSLASRATVIAVCLGMTPGILAQRTVDSPLRAAGHAAGVTTLELDAAAYEGLRAAGQVTLRGFPLDAVRRVDLEVVRFEVLAPDARIVAASAAGTRPLGRPDLVLLRGRVAGEPGSAVFLGLSPHGTNGYVVTGGATHIISSGPAAGGQTTVIHELGALPPDTLTIRPFVCGTERLEHPAVPLGGGGGGGEPGGGCRTAEIAVETDWEFTGDLFGGDIVASAAYATALLGAVGEIFNRDAGTAFEVLFLRVWEDNSDPWTEKTAFEQFSQFRDYWNANMTGEARDAAHFLSGRPLPGAGGIGYLPGLCQTGFDYAISMHLNGFFPYPLEDNHEQNWDVFVVSHELGHNFGAPHTHSMAPPVDGCGLGDCSDAANGTIMSYCHTCPGGLTNIALRFHERTLEEAILPYLETISDCVPGEPGPHITGHPVDAEVCVGETAVFTVTAGGSGTITYQWFKDGFRDLPGETDTSLIILDVGPDDVGNYYVVVGADCGSITSQSAALTLTPDCCVGDLDGDNLVSTPDLLLMLGGWGLSGPGDLDGNGIVSTNDLLLMLGNWGPCL